MNCNNHRHGTLTLKAMAVDPDGRDIDPETETQQIKALRDPSSKTYMRLLRTFAHKWKMIIQ